MDDVNATTGAVVTLRNVRKEYGGVVAVEGADLEIGRGEFFTILGPSGSGKTTILRMLAGLIQPTSGEILIDGESVVGKKPYERDISMVFQSLALFPHLSVAGNIAFPLRMRRWGQREIAARIREVLEIVRLPEIQDRAVDELSGGQRQRVALARSLAYRPSLLLLDEPLGALDRRLREDMQLELARLHQEIDVTIMNVTHDQREALMLSDRMAVMNLGTVAQVGSATQLYLEPASQFVATFLGDAVLVSGSVAAEGGRTWLICEGSRIEVESDLPHGALAAVVLRSENVKIGASESSLLGCHNQLRGQIDVAVFEGAGSYCEVSVPEIATTLKVSISRDQQEFELEHGREIWVGWSATDAPVIGE